MKIKCDYCGSEIDSDQSNCPNCGAVLNHVRAAADSPKTIEELKQWYKDRNLPDESVTRFFIGKDIREPKAFGIYRDANGDFVVYKNKSDGTRAVRYEGTDEEYAVNEIYQRLKSEIADQKAHGGPARNFNKGSDTSHKPIDSSKDYYSDPDIKDSKKNKYTLNDFGPILKTVITVAIMLLAITFIIKIFAALATIPVGSGSGTTNDDYQYNYDYNTNNWWDSDDSDSDSDSGSSWWSDSGSDSSSDSWWDDNDDWDWDSDSNWDSSDSWDSDWSGSDWDSDW